VTQWSLTLEQKVVEKTEELNRAQRQVLHMEKMASLGKLAASMAHELNNPISGVLTYARLIRRELDGQSLDPETREEWTRYLTLIDRECARCGGIVQNLLLFSRRSDTESAPVDMNLVVEHCLMLVRHHLEMKGVSLQTQLLPDESTIVADGGQIQQALLALLVNAIEALGGLEPGEGELGVRLRGSPEEIQIEVSDNGSGIAVDVLPHIFEPFFSTKHKENGVGLGLAVVYGIVERHGGGIDVDSAPGRGTTFCVRLPRTPPPAAPPQDDDPPGRPGAFRHTPPT
jgi:two-component system NtrC family sensor kinase